MDINKILKSDYLDILFDGRNKEYGSYELRRKYPKRMRNAGIIGISVIALALAIPVIANIADSKNKKITIANLTEIKLAEPPPIDPNQPPPPPPPPAPPPPVKPTIAFTPPVIKKDEEVREEEKPPEQTQMEDKAISTVTQEGDPDGIDPGLLDSKGTGVVEAAPAPQIFEFVEQMPEFPGGNDKVSRYLADKMRYPEMARENNIQGRVIVRFVVNESGEISDVQVQRGIGGGCDEEAVRVVKGMPKWKPGRQNGRPVKVYFTLPITFRLE